MQELQYLNVALNNISKFQNLQRCESLQKLDVTLNFISKAGLLSVHTLQHNLHLRDLHCLGNPCTQWSGYRSYVIAMVPTLHTLVRTPLCLTCNSLWHDIQCYPWCQMQMPHFSCCLQELTLRMVASCCRMLHDCASVVD